MIGMVNAAGTAQAVREHSAGRQTARQAGSPDVGEPPMWVRPQKDTQTEADSARAVSPVDFQRAESERKLPDGDGSTEVGRSEHLAQADRNVGRELDTTA